MRKVVVMCLCCSHAWIMEEQYYKGEENCPVCKIMCPCMVDWAKTDLVNSQKDSAKLYTSP